MSGLALSAAKYSTAVPKSANDFISNLGYNKKMGARPIARFIDDKIKKPLANEIIHGKLIDGGTVLIDTNKEEFVFKIKKSVVKKFAKQIN